MSNMTDLLFLQLESMTEDEDRPEDECKLLRIIFLQLRDEFARLAKIESASSRVAHQTSAEKAYALHDDLIVALDGKQ